MYDDISKTVNILEMIDLVHIPELNNVLAAKLEVLEDVDLRALIADYKGKERRCYETLFRDSRRGDESLYWFELIQYEEGEWRIAFIEPKPSPQTTSYGILPRDVIGEIVKTGVNPDNVVTMNGVCSPSLNKAVDLQLVRLSPTHLVGTVKDSVFEGEETPLEGPVTLDGDMDAAFRVFFHSLNSNPSITKELIRVFLNRILPELKQLEAEAEGKTTRR